MWYIFALALSLSLLFVSLSLFISLSLLLTHKQKRKKVKTSCMLHAANEVGTVERSLLMRRPVARRLSSLSLPSPLLTPSP